MGKITDYRYNKKGISVGELRSILCRPRTPKNGKVRPWDYCLRVPVPGNDMELEILSARIFGKPLHLHKLDAHNSNNDSELSVSYQVLEDHASYYDHRFMEILENKSEFCFSSYDLDKVFWATVFGGLYCGGIARASYGQTRISGHRNRQRIMNWVNIRRSNSGASYPRASFVRLVRCS